MRYIYLLIFSGLILSQQSFAQCQIDENQIIIELDGTAGQINSEVSWELYDNFTNTLVSSFPEGSLGAGIQRDTLCLQDEVDYRFEAYDSYGDGWNEATYRIIYPDGFVIQTGMPNNGDFGNGESQLEETFIFTSGSRPGDDCSLPKELKINQNFFVNTAQYSNSYESNPLFDSGREAIFSFSPKVTDNYTISLAEIPNPNNGSIQLFDNCLDASPTLLDSATTGETETFIDFTQNLIQGTTYYIVVSNDISSGTDTIAGNLNIAFSGDPINTNCENALTLEIDGDSIYSRPSLIIGQSFIKAIENMELEVEYSVSYKDSLFYDFTLASPEDILIEIGDYAISSGLIIELEKKENCGEEAEATFRRGAQPDVPKVFSFSGLDAGTYRLKIYPPSSFENSFYAAVKTQSSQLPASNQDCLSALELGVSGFEESTGSNNFSTLSYFNATDSGIGVPCAQDSIFPTGTGDIWVKAQVPASGDLVVETIGEIYDIGSANQGVETRFSVYTGTCGSLNEFYCSDKFEYHQRDTVSGLPQGEEVFIRLWDRNGDNSGLMNVRLLEPEPLPKPEVNVSSFSDSLSVEFTNFSANTEFFYEVYVSDDSFATYLPDFNPANISSFEGGFGVGGLQAATTYYFQVFSKKDKLSNSDTTFFEFKTEPLIVNTVANGDWSDPNTWAGGNVPLADSAVNIRHQVFINESESFDINSVIISGGAEIAPNVGLWINNGSLNVENNVFVNHLIDNVTDSTGIFITTDAANSASINIGSNLIFELNDANLSDQLLFTAINNGDSLKINVGNEFSFRHNATDNTQTYDSPNILFDGVDLKVGGNWFFFNGFSSSQPFNAEFIDSNIEVDVFQLDAISNTSESYQINFSGNTQLDVNFDFRRTGAGGKINFQDASTLRFLGFDQRSIVGFGMGQDSIIYNNIIIDMVSNLQAANLNVENSYEELNTQILINGELNLINGFINNNNDLFSAVTSEVIFGPNASVTGTNPNAYVSGRVSKIGNTPFTFPLGEETGLKQIRISNNDGFLETDIVKVANINNFCGDSDFMLVNSSLARDRTQEYWQVTSQLFDNNVTASLSPIILNPSTAGITDFSSLELVDFRDGSSYGNAASSDTSFITATDYNFSIADTARFGLATNVDTENPFYIKKEIVSLSQYSAFPGENITFNLSDDFGLEVNTVFIGGKRADIVNISENSMNVIVPEGTRSGEIEMIYNTDKVIYGKEQLIIKYNTPKQISPDNYQNQNLLQNINGTITLGATKMSLGLIDGDQSFDAMIVSQDYEPVSLVNNLSGATSLQEIDLNSDGTTLNPLDFELGLVSNEGNVSRSTFMKFENNGQNGIIYFENDGNGSFNTIGDGQSENETIYNDFIFYDSDFDGFTDAIFSLTDLMSSSNIIVGEGSNGGTDCSPYAKPILPYVEPNGKVMNQILRGDFIANNTSDLAYLVADESMIGILDVYAQDTTFFYSNNSRSSNQIFEIIKTSLNSDGVDQIIASNQTTNEIEIYNFNNGTETIDISTVSLSFTPAKMNAEDINGDGFQDLIVSDQNTAALHLLMNDGMGQLSEDISFNYSGGILVDFDILDLNNDGFKDFVILQEGGQLSAVYFTEAEIGIPQPEVSNVNSNGFDLSWNSIPDVSQYQVYIGLNNNVNSIEENDTLFVVSNETISYNAPEYSELYFYLVRAITSSGDTSNFSPQNSVKLPISSYLQQDSLALVSLYENGNGENWINNNNWLTGKLNTWEGLTMKNDTLLSINLPSNEIEGVIPSEFESLNFIEEINFSGNILTDVSAIVPLIEKLNSLDISANELSFEQLEPLSSVPIFNYENQNYEYTLPEEYFDFLGADILITVEATSSSNTYQWYKDSVQIEGETSANLLIEDILRADEGFYFVEVRNNSLGDLILSSSLTELKVSTLERDVAALRQFYNTTGGENWSTITWDTSSENPTEWSEDEQDIVVEDNRVVEINLRENNLSGSATEILNEIRGLRSIDLSNNAIENLADLTSLPNLISLNVNGNALGYDDLEPNISIQGFEFGNQANFGNLGNQRIFQGSDFLISYEIGGTSNAYDWYLNGELQVTAETSEFSIDSITFEKMGEYELRVRNSIINEIEPDFTINSNPILVTATANLSGQVQDANEFVVESGRVFPFKISASGSYDSVRLDDGNFFTNIQSNGSFELMNLDLGTYVIYIDNDEINYPKLLNTYYQNTIDWELADPVSLRTNTNDLTITMEGQPLELNGTSRLSGFLEEEVEENERILRRRRVSGAGVSVRRIIVSSREPAFKSILENGELVAYIETDGNGEFEIPNLPAGRYSIKFDIPGVPMDEESDIIFDLTGEDQEALEISALSDNGKITVSRLSYTANTSSLEQNITIYPNPSNGKFRIEVEDAISSIKIISSDGRQIEKLSDVEDYGKEIDLSNYPDGMYLMQITWKNGLRSMSKLIKE